MAQPKQPTPQGISALLRKAGFERSVRSTTRVRGYSSRSQGYVVGGGKVSAVTVYHEDSSFMRTDATVERCVREQARYAEAIEAAGYAVERGSGGLFGPLIVRALPEEA